MERNVGGYDRIGRYVVGAILVIAAVAGYAGMLRLAVGPVPQTLAAVILLVVGAILLVTGYTQKCPINRALGISTLRRS